jgi:hypothetical protein
LTEDNPRLEAARAYAARGWWVFPCRPQQKVPAVKHGWQDATRDPEQIRAWWSENPAYNVAIATGPSGLTVIDVDPNGLDEWRQMLANDSGLREAVEAAPTINTPRDGLHIYMTGEGPTSASKIAPGIDTRGAGGYVLAPPSYVNDGKSNGQYTGTPDATYIPPVYTPLIAPLLNKPERQAPVLPPAERKWDEPETLARAEAWLAGLVLAGDVAVEGMGGDQRTYEVCCGLLEMAISPEIAKDLLLEHWNPHCVPPWDEPDLATKILNAWKFGQETRGGKAERPVAEQFAHLLEQPDDEEDEETPENVFKQRYTPKLLKDARKDRPALEWIVPDLIPAKGIGILFGAPQTFKTFLMYDLAMSVATGWGPNWWEGERDPQPVLFLAGESPDALVTKRTDAWLAKSLLPGLEDRAQLYVVEGVPPFEMSDYWRHVVEWLKEHGVRPRLVIIDTLTRAMAGWDENSAKDATRTTMKMESLSRELGAMVIAVHHSGKDTTRGARGSSVWLGNTDVMFEAERLSPNAMEVLVHLRKLKEGGLTDMPLKFDGQIYGAAPAFVRDWKFEPVEEAAEVVQKKDTEEWLQPDAIAAELASGPMMTDHLADSLATKYGVEKRTTRRKLRDAALGRYRAWVPTGDTWMIPDTHPAKTTIREEDF